MKICSGCDKEKETTEFHKNKSKKSGLCSYCKSCSKHYMIEYQSQNAERISKYNAERYRNRKR